MEPLRILTFQQMEMIDDAAGEILERTGMKIACPEALDFLKNFGCQVDLQTSIVKFPRKITAQVIKKMKADYHQPGRPQRMPVRFSHVRFQSTPYQVHRDFTVNAGGFCCFIHDLDGQRRQANSHDVLCSINMVNALDQIDYTGLPVADQTIPAKHRPVVMAGQLAKYTKKLGGIEVFRKEDIRPIYEIAQIVSPTPKQLRENPVLVGYAETRSPLCFDTNMVEIFMEYIKMGLPQTVDTMPAGGSTAPVTAAAILALSAAETIGAMTLAYAIRDDAIVAMDISPSYTDMSSGIYKYSGADRLNLLMARVQLLAEFYGCPTGVHGGKTDSCFYDEQAGAEKMSSMLLAVLAGAVGIGTIGQLENGVTFSPVQLVTDNEMVRYVRRAVREPVIVNTETLAVDLIDKVGPQGQFLGESHTAEHFRDELFHSPLFPAQPWESAYNNKDQYQTSDKAAQLAADLWQQPQEPVLNDDQIKAINAVVKKATGCHDNNDKNA